MGSIQTQMLFKKLRDQYRRIGKGRVMLTQSNLVLVQDIVANQTRYLFELLNNQGNPKSYEIRLSQNDAFHLTSAQLFIGLGAAPDDPQIETLTYPNQVSIVAAGSVAADYRSVYQGTFDVEIDNVKVIQDLSSNFARYVPQTQGLVIGAANAIDQQRLSSDSMFNFAPTINLSGAKKTDIVFNLPQGIASAVPNQVLYMKLNGIVAIGGSIFQS